MDKQQVIHRYMRSVTRTDHFLISSVQTAMEFVIHRLVRISFKALIVRKKKNNNNDKSTLSSALKPTLFLRSCNLTSISATIYVCMAFRF